MGDVKYYMGCHITRDRKARELELNQHLHVKSIVEKLGAEKASWIPSSSGVAVLSNASGLQTPVEKEEMSKFPHRDAVGTLMSTLTKTRPDIPCVVRAVVWFCNNPGLMHKKAMLKVMQHLLYTKG